MALKKDKKFVFEDEILKKTEKKQPLFTEADYVNPDDRIVLGNPFTYNVETANVKINSIEEFGLKYKRKYVYLGSIIRNPKIKYRKKIKVLNKYLNKNKKDFNLRMKEIDKKRNNSEDNFEGVKFYYDKLITAFLILFGFLVNIFLFILFDLFNWHIFTSGWFYDLQETLRAGLENNIIKSIVIGGTVTTIFLIVWVVFYWIKYSIYRKEQRKYREVMRKGFRLYNKSFKKLFKKVKKYYFKKIKKCAKTNGYLEYDPLALDELWHQKIDLNSMAKSSEEIRTKTDELIKFQKKHKLLKIFLLFLVCSVDIALIVYIIVHGIIKLH